MSIVFEDHGETVRIRDETNQRQYRLTIPADSQLSASDSGVFSPYRDDEAGIDFAVEETRTFTADTFGVPELVVGLIRRLDGSLVADIHDAGGKRFPEDAYVVELDPHLKVFIRFEGAFRIIYEEEGFRVLLEDETEIYVGARSVSRTPRRTLTVDESIESVYRVLNQFGDSLVTLSPERSWPTLRDHPPRVKHDPTAETLQERTPETGIELHVPRDREFLYAAAPLAYYLDAHVVPSPNPRVLSEGDEVASFADASAFAFSQDVQEMLKHQFTLDVLTRLEGFYPVDLFERELLTYADVGINWRELYELELSERVVQYQEIPRSVTRRVEPRWRTTATVTDAVENVETLPYLIDELALIQPLREPKTDPEASEMAEAVSSFLRTPAEDSEAGHRFVSPEKGESIESVYAGDGVPVGSSKLLVEGYEADLSREATPSDISIQVVCNDESMRHEVEEDLYGGREEFPFTVDTAFGVSVSELRDILQSDRDFIHYIGHLDGEYFYCPDGRLDPAELDDVGVRAFLLNGCESFGQAEALVRAGASGGIATVSRVADERAAEVGVMVAKLLDEGFSIRGALELAREHQLIGSQYVGVGDSGLSLVQSEGGIPTVTNVRTTSEAGMYSVVIETYPSNAVGMGALYRPFLGRIEKYFISGGETARVRVTERELQEFLEQDYLEPVVFEDEFFWSPDVIERFLS